MSFCGTHDRLDRRASLEAIQNQDVAAEEKEQKNALKDPCQRIGHAEIDLRGVAAEVGERQQQSAEDCADRMQAAEKRNDDGREAVTRRNARGELPDGAGVFENSRNSR